MCGIVGFYSLKEKKEDIINEMMKEIIHRGPDSDGKYIDNNIALGFRRLSIIDLEGGDQPLFNENKDMVLIFNGEIYNHQVLRDQLIGKGHIFETHSDSEVILHCYEEYGTKTPEMLRGMFSFVIWDKNEKRIFGARDYFGIKPFYYYKTDDMFMFGSELKSFLKHPDFEKELNEDTLENYLSFQYSPTDETFFKNVFKLPPAHYFIYENNEIKITRYWEPIFEEQDKSLEEWTDTIEETLVDSVKHHKISDVEVGCFLSSGVDSSYITALFKGSKTFTVGFDNHKYNEISAAKETSNAIGIKNYDKVISEKEYWDVLKTVQYHMDEPLADPAAIALYFVCQKASEYVKVVLSGEGADELFGGYNIYKEPMDISFYTALPKPFRKVIAKLATKLPDMKGKNFLIRASKDIEERYIGNAFMFTEAERKKLLKIETKAPSLMEITKPIFDKVADKDDVTKMQYLDIHTWLSGDILLKADRMSMAHSLELRVPFLDKEVCEMSTKIPLKYRVNKDNTKYAMRMAARRSIPKVAADRKKLGFPVPIRVWLKEEKYFNLIKEEFNSEIATKFFNTDELMILLNNHYTEKKDNSRKIWTVYMFLVWYENYFPES